MDAEFYTLYVQCYFIYLYVYVACLQHCCIIYIQVLGVVFVFVFGLTTKKRLDNFKFNPKLFQVEVMLESKQGPPTLCISKKGAEIPQ